MKRFSVAQKIVDVIEKLNWSFYENRMIIYYTIKRMVSGKSG